jgi:hypothetical protein
MQKKTFVKLNILLASYQPQMKKAGSGNVCQWYGSADSGPDQDQNVTDPQYWQKLTDLSSPSCTVSTYRYVIYSFLLTKDFTT